MGVQGRGAGSQALGDSAGPRLDRQQCPRRRSPLNHHPGRQRCPGLSYSCLVSSEEDLGSQLASKQERGRATRQGLPRPGLPVADLIVGVVPAAGTPRPQLWSVQEKQPSQAGSACTRPGELGVWCPPGQHWPSRPLPRTPSEQPARNLVSVIPRAQQHSGGARAAGRGGHPRPLRLLTYRPLSPGPLCLSESEERGHSRGPAQHFLTGLPGPLMGV